MTCRAAAGILFLASALVMGGIAPESRAAKASVPPALRPYRVLLVASVQIRDDAAIHSAWDTGDIAGLLTLWGVPFDILRLDRTPLTEETFAGPEGRPRYGAIIWTARDRAEHPWMRQDYTIAARAAARFGTGFIAVGNKIQEPPIQALVGLRYESFAEIKEPVKIASAAHFITRGLVPAEAPAAEAFGEGGPRVRVAASDTVVLAAAGPWPQLTARTVDARTRTRAVWIGGHPDQVFRKSAFFIQALRRALVWVLGYGFYKDYEKTVVLRMDDPGSSQSAYFKGWDYAQLDAAALERDVLAPLRERRARLGVAFCPGYPWIPERKIRHSAALDFVDPRGVRQNLVSLAAGLKAGLADGLLDILSHGLTHMPPDLDTPPPGGKSWWNGDWDHEWPDERWYREFRDERRGRDVGASIQLEVLRRSADWIAEDLGVRPLVFVPGGHVISGEGFVGGPESDQPSHVAENYTYKLAAEAGYGLALDLTAHFLSPERVVTLTACAAQELEADFARHVPAVRYFHDKDVRADPRCLAKILESIDPDAAFLGPDEWVAYLHTRLGVETAENGGLALTVDPDPIFGRFFAGHPSTWTLHLDDDLRRELKASRPLPETQRLLFPAGSGAHRLVLGTGPAK